MDNLELYNKVSQVPSTAQKTITGGRLNGMTDINPMWRIKALTEQFGPCGIGWVYTIQKQWLEPAGNEIAAFVNIELKYRHNGEWSFPVPGTGGSMFYANEKNGLRVSDECYKMALTDAISVAAKALGVGANVYWDKDTTKYDKADKPATTPTKPPTRAQADKPPTNPPSKPQPASKGNSDANTAMECAECKKPLNKAVYDWSVKAHGRPLCYEHQQQAKQKLPDGTTQEVQDNDLPF